MKAPHIFLGLLAALLITVWILDTPPVPLAQEGTVTITYWEKWTGFEGEAMKATVDYFNDLKIKNKKGQIIRCEYLTTTNVDRKSLLAIAGGQPPDLAGFWSGNTHVFADMGALMPLDEFIERDHFDMDKYIDVYRRSCTYRAAGDTQERVWCLVTTPASVALHWNKEMFKEAGLDPEQPPRTIQELMEYNRKLTKRDDKGKIIQMGFLPIEPGWWNWAWGYWFGGQLNDGFEKLTADDPRNIAAWDWVVSFTEGYRPEVLQAFSSSFGSAFDSPQNAFMAGKVAMVVQGVWMANFIRFHNPNLQWGCGPMPAAFDTQGQPVTVAEMDVITIPRGCKHPDEAWEAIKFINSLEGMEYLCGKATNRLTGKENTGGQGKLTPFKENSPGWIERHSHPYLRVFIDLAKSKNAHYTPQLAVWEEYRSELDAAFQRAWLQKATPAEALQQVQERMQPKLEQALRIRRYREMGN
ncbi:MAG: ABC transporter substrate-binding protein [Planctomycetota bacterium]|nr:ABC transporter substrate-binding protein [Planctomycetota bacterium]